MDCRGLHPDSGRVQTYDVSNGLPNNEFNTGAQFRSDTGELYFGGVGGFTFFKPESIRTNSHPPQLALTRVQVMNRDVTPGRFVELGYRDQLMTFEYAALDFTAPQRNTYKHRLIGFDQEWVDDGALHRATYTNLAPGDYVFQVMAANNDGVWSTQPLTVNLRATPPPWATPLAKAGYLLLALALALLAYRTQSRRLAVARQIHSTNLLLRAEIEERQAQERALIRERENAQRYLDIVEVMILALDPEGTVLRVNQKGTRVLGYPEWQIIGTNFYDRLVPADIRDRVRQQFQGVAQYDYFESPIVTKDGTERLIAWHTTPLPATDHDPRGLLISGADVTQVRQLEQQLRDSQRMDALGTLASGIAHDFNNILTSILGFAQLTQATVARGSKAAGYLDRLQTSVDRAKGLVQAILTFGRRARQTQRPSSLAMIAREALQLLRPSLPANIEIRTRDRRPLRRGVRRPEPAASGRDESMYERVPGDRRRRRRADDRRRGARGRRGGSAFESCARNRRARSPDRQRYRRRYGRGYKGAHLRPVLHDEAARRRNRARSCRWYTAS